MHCDAHKARALLTGWFHIKVLEEHAVGDYQFAWEK